MTHFKIEKIIRNVIYQSLVDLRLSYIMHIYLKAFHENCKNPNENTLTL